MSFDNLHIVLHNKPNKGNPLWTTALMTTSIIHAIAEKMEAAPEQVAQRCDIYVVHIVDDRSIHTQSILSLQRGIHPQWKQEMVDNKAFIKKARALVTLCFAHDTKTNLMCRPIAIPAVFSSTASDTLPVLFDRNCIDAIRESQQWPVGQEPQRLLRAMNRYFTNGQITARQFMLTHPLVPWRVAYRALVNHFKEAKRQMTECSNNCGCASGLLKACGGCKMVMYCGPACQKAHWRLRHKEECKEMMAQSDLMRGTSSVDMEGLPAVLEQAWSGKVSTGGMYQTYQAISKLIPNGDVTFSLCESSVVASQCHQ